MNPAENPDLVEIGVPFREIAAYLGMTIAEVKLHNPDLEHVAEDAFLPSGLAIHTGRTPSSSITRQRTSKNNSAPVSNSNSNVNSMNPNSVSTVPTESKLEDVPDKIADGENNNSNNTKPEFQPETTTVESVSKHLGISPEELRKENPQLDKLVESNQHPIPVGTALKIPKKSASPKIESNDPNKNNNTEQNEKGQSLRQISEATGVSVSALREQNPQLSHLLAVDDDDTIIPLGTPMKIKTKPKTPQQKENDKNESKDSNNIDEDAFDFTVTNPNHDKNTNSLKNLSTHMGMPIEEIRRKNPWLKQKRIKDEDELPFGAALNFASDNDEESENEAEFDVGDIKNKSNEHHLDDPRLHHHQHQPSQVTVSPQIEPNSFEYISRQTGIPVHILRASNADKIGKDYDSRKAIPEGTKLTVSRNCLPLIRHQADGLNPDKNHHRGHHRHRSHVHHPDLHKNQHENEKPPMLHNNNTNNANNNNDNNNNNKHASLGQSLLEIAQRTGVSTQNLREWNPSISHFADCDIVPNETALKIKRKKNNNNINVLETPPSTGETERADSSLTPSEQHCGKLNATRSDVHQDDLLSSDDERERNELHHDHHHDIDLKNNFLSVPKQNSPTPSSSPTTTIRDALAHSRKNVQVSPAESQHQNDEETFLRNLFVQTSLVSAEKDLRSNVKDEEHEKRSDLILNHNRTAANIISRDLRQKQHVKIQDDPEVLSSSPTTPRNSPSSPLKQAEKMKQQQQQQREEETLLRTLYASQTLSNAERTHRSKLENDEKAELIDFIMMKGQLRQAEQIRRDAEIQNLHKKQQEVDNAENERRLRQDRERDDRQRNEEALNNQKQQQQHQLRNSFQKQERHRLELDESVHRGEMKMEAKEEFDDLGAEINQRIKILERREIQQQHQHNRAHNSSNPASNHKNLHHSSTSPYEDGDDDITPRHSTRQPDHHAFDTSNVAEEEDPDDLAKIKAHASGKLPEIIIDDPSPIQNKSLVNGFDSVSASSGSPLLRPRTSFRNNDSNNRNNEDDETPRADFSFAPTPFHNQKNTNHNKNALKTAQIPPSNSSYQESSAFIGKSRRRQNEEEGRTSPTNDELIAEESGVKQAPMKLPPRRPTNMYPRPPNSTSQLAQNGSAENSKNNNNHHLSNFNENVKRSPLPPPPQAKSKPSNGWASPETLDLTTNTTATTTTTLDSKTPYSSFNFKQDNNINHNNDYYPERKSPVSPPPVPATLLMNQDGSHTFSQNSTPENFIARQMNSNNNNNSNNFNHHQNQSGDDDEDAEYECETLETISYKTGVPVSKLKEFNPSLKNLDAKQILPEGTLIRTQPLRDVDTTEKQSKNSSSTKKIHNDDRFTLESISNETGHSVDEIRAANPQIVFFKRDQEIPSHIQVRAPTKPQSNNVENVPSYHDANNRKMSSPAKPSSTILQNVGHDDDSFLHSREKLRSALQKDFDDSRPHVQEKKNREANNQKTLKNLAAKYNMTPGELREVDPATLGALNENDEISPIVALRIENAIKTNISQRQQKQDREKEKGRLEKESERQHLRKEAIRRERISTDGAKKQEDYAITDSDDEDYYFDRLGKRHLKETNVYGKRDDKNDDEYLDEEGRSELYVQQQRILELSNRDAARRMNQERQNRRNFSVDSNASTTVSAHQADDNLSQAERLSHVSNSNNNNTFGKVPSSRFANNNINTNASQQEQPKTWEVHHLFKKKVIRDASSRSTSAGTSTTGASNTSPNVSPRNNDNDEAPHHSRNSNSNKNHNNIVDSNFSTNNPKARNHHLEMKNHAAHSSPPRLSNLKPVDDVLEEDRRREEEKKKIYASRFGSGGAPLSPSSPLSSGTNENKIRNGNDSRNNAADLMNQLSPIELNRNNMITNNKTPFTSPFARNSLNGNVTNSVNEAKATNNNIALDFRPTSPSRTSPLPIQSDNSKFNANAGKPIRANIAPASRWAASSTATDIIPKKEEEKKPPIPMSSYTLQKSVHEQERMKNAPPLVQSEAKSDRAFNNKNDSPDFDRNAQQSQMKYGIRFSEAPTEPPQDKQNDDDDGDSEHQFSMFSANSKNNFKKQSSANHFDAQTGASSPSSSFNQVVPIYKREDYLSQIANKLAASGRAGAKPQEQNKVQHPIINEHNISVSKNQTGISSLNDDKNRDTQFSRGDDVRPKWNPLDNVNVEKSADRQPATPFFVSDSRKRSEDPQQISLFGRNTVRPAAALEKNQNVYDTISPTRRQQMLHKSEYFVGDDSNNKNRNPKEEKLPSYAVIGQPTSTEKNLNSSPLINSRSSSKSYFVQSPGNNNNDQNYHHISREALIQRNEVMNNNNNNTSKPHKPKPVNNYFVSQEHTPQKPFTVTEGSWEINLRNRPFEEPHSEKNNNNNLNPQTEGPKFDRQILTEPTPLQKKLAEEREKRRILEDDEETKKANALIEAQNSNENNIGYQPRDYSAYIYRGAPTIIPNNQENFHHHHDLPQNSAVDRDEAGDFYGTTAIPDGFTTLKELGAQLGFTPNQIRHANPQLSFYDDDGLIPDTELFNLPYDTEEQKREMEREEQEMKDLQLAETLGLTLEELNEKKRQDETRQRNSKSPWRKFTWQSGKQNQAENNKMNNSGYPAQKRSTNFSPYSQPPNRHNLLSSNYGASNNNSNSSSSKFDENGNKIKSPTIGSMDWIRLQQRKFEQQLQNEQNEQQEGNNNTKHGRKFYQSEHDAASAAPMNPSSAALLGNNSQQNSRDIIHDISPNSASQQLLAFNSPPNQASKISLKDLSLVFSIPPQTLRKYNPALNSVALSKPVPSHYSVILGPSSLAAKNRIKSIMMLRVADGIETSLGSLAYENGCSAKLLRDLNPEVFSSYDSTSGSPRNVQEEEEIDWKPIPPKTKLRIPMLEDALSPEEIGVLEKDSMTMDDESNENAEQDRREVENDILNNSRSPSSFPTNVSLLSLAHAVGVRVDDLRRCNKSLELLTSNEIIPSEYFPIAAPSACYATEHERFWRERVANSLSPPKHKQLRYHLNEMTKNDSLLLSMEQNQASPRTKSAGTNHGSRRSAVNELNATSLLLKQSPFARQNSYSSTRGALMFSKNGGNAGISPDRGRKHAQGPMIGFPYEY